MLPIRSSILKSNKILNSPSIINFLSHNSSQSIRNISSISLNSYSKSIKNSGTLPSTQLLFSLNPSCSYSSKISRRSITRFFKRDANSKLNELEEEANEYPNDAETQSQYLSALNESGEYNRVIQRIETNRYAHNKNTQREYDRAKQALHINNPMLSNYHQPITTPNYANSPYPPQHYGQPMYSSHPVSMSAPPPHYEHSPSYMHSDLGTKHHPITVELKNFGPEKPSTLQILLRLTLWGSLLYLLYYGFNQSVKQLGSGGPMSRTFKEYQPDGSVPKVTFADVKGCDEAKSELEEIVAYLKNPASFQKLGGKMPKGVLLTGPPGTGKTLLARAIAGEAEVPFFSCSGSEFEEIFVGVGAKRIRELFANARKKHPCIIFIDEIDAIGGKRSHRDLSATRASLNQLLTEMDGFDSQLNGVIVIGATNLPEFLDPALIRPGRFDRHVVVPVPDVKGRKQILDLYASKVPLAEDVDLQILARGTPGTTGADLFNIVNSAALRASANKLDKVTMAELEYAKDKILMGAERISQRMTEEVRKMTAYHEGGHALVAIKSQYSMPIHKATILPRGSSLGMTMQLPESDRVSQSKAQMLAQLDVLMGGRVAENIIFGSEHVSTGASNDLERASQIARAMIVHYGMGDKTGVLSVPNRESWDSLSDETKRQIDQEVKEILSASYQRATTLLTSNINELHQLADALLKYETLDSKEIMKAIQGEPLKKEL